MTGLVASVGAGSGKQIAKIASGLAKPDGIRVVRRDEERCCWTGLPVRRLWGIGPVAEEKLHRLGIETIGAVRRADRMRRRPTSSAAPSGPRCTGWPGASTTGRSPRTAEAKQISAESTFPEDLTTLEQLQQAVGPIGDHAHTRLMKDGRGARTVTVKLKRSDMSTLTRSADAAVRHRRRRHVDRDAARRLLLDPLEVGPIRLVGVGFSGLSEVRQESLFPDLELWPKKCPTPAFRRHSPSRRAAPGLARSATTCTTASTATAGSRAPATG